MTIMMLLAPRMLTMLKRSFALIAILAGTTYLSDASALQPQPLAQQKGPTFVITKVTYNAGAGNVDATFNAKGIAQIPAGAVVNAIIIAGTYTPASDPVPMFAGTINAFPDIGVAVASGTPTLVKDGTWSFTAPAKSFGTNQNYSISTTVKGGAAGTVMINGAVVTVTKVTLTVSDK